MDGGMKTQLLIIVTMLGFATNSILGRLALGASAIDAVSFTALRLLSGAVALAIILGFRKSGGKRSACKKDPVAVVALFTYAICFSLAYLELSTGTGALILFGAVQFTMMSVGLLKGSRPAYAEWGGIVLAMGGMVYLLLPGVSMPSLHGALLMGISGTAWGIYSIRGGNAGDPVGNTAWNFIGTVPLAVLCVILFRSALHVSAKGVLLAISSGAVASALSYIIWYTVLPRLKTSAAATVQISVPLLAAMGGVLFLDERITVRLVIAGVAILAGIGLVIRAQEGQKARGLTIH